MRTLEQVVLATIALSFFTVPAAGWNLVNVEVSKTLPSSTTFSSPPATTSFLTTDTNVYEYFAIQNMNAGAELGETV